MRAHILAAAVMVATSVQAADAPVVGGYFADWQYTNEASPFTVQDIPAEKLTHVIYAFLSLCGPHTGASEAVQQQVATACEGKEPGTAIIVDRLAALEYDFGDVAAEVEYKGHFAQLAQLKDEHPHLNILPSFGGWTMSEPFHAMVKSTEEMDRFAKTSVELIAQYDFFTGIDLDWEYPGGGGLTTSPWNPDTKMSDEQKAAERDAFTYLVKAIRTELNGLEKQTGREYELSTAVGVGPKAQQIDWANAAQYLTHMFAMTYDYLGGWGTQTGHLTNLHTTERSWWGMGSDVFIQQMLDAGIPREKLVLGAAFYGRGWEGTENFDGKLPTSDLTSTGGASFGTNPNEPAYFMFWDLIANYTAEEGYQYGYDAESEAPFLWNSEKQVYISFDDVRSVTAKAKWAKAQNLAGVFSWELSGDPENKLTEAMHNVMMGEDK
ncbi:glycoside hydrolase family 18 protein [Thaumasiovibrio subtropicus]|uniref:glycoside hydrolase family 18 protein n=1 Tax=Thaumasiovibrio subtropicus TaxID=1891207 RepID=UPI000B36160D|nr:glycoside hydrolase family 18 protein [Thaumasiovibrio subtropicus]